MLLYWLIISTLVGGALFGEGSLLRCVQAHLLLNDASSAASDARAALLKENTSENLTAGVLAFAASGDEKSMMQCYDSLRRLGGTIDKTLYEQMAWGILDNGANSKEPLTRVISLVSAAKSDSANSVIHLKRGMKDSSVLVRSVAVELSKKMRDRILQDEVIRLLQEDPSWHVQSACLRSLGSMQAKQAEPLLEKICRKDFLAAEERALAVMSLASLKEECSREDLIKLVHSGREGLKLLALELLVNGDDTEDLDILKPLLEDRSKDVRIAALQVLGILGGASKGWQRVCLNDRQPEVQLTAAWVALLNSEDLGATLLIKGINHPSKDVRLYAAGLLKASGDAGRRALAVAFRSAKDPHVKLNLAVGVLSTYESSPEACLEISRVLKSGGRLMWKQVGIVRVLSPSEIKYRPEIAGYPELVDQLTRLEVIQILAIKGSEHAESALRDFLARKFTPVSGMAATVMFEEAEEEAERLVRKLLDDESELIRAQAALLLALWGKEEEAAEKLVELYPTSERNLKERILEALGRVGSKNAVPFLIERFSEPHEHLRILAASSLIQCLNH